MTRALKVTGICSLILLCLMLLSDPHRLPSIVLIVPFALLFVILFLATRLLLTRFGVAGQKQLRLSLLASVIPVLLLCLQSLGQLTTRDVLVIAALFCIVYFYLARFSMQSAGR